MAHGYNIDQRKINKRNYIIDLFRQNESLSKAQAKSLSGYSMDTVISIFDILINNEIIIPTTGDQKAKGRKASFYKLNNDKAYYLGITFNQLRLDATLTGLSGQIVEHQSIEFAKGLTKELFIEKLTTQITQIIQNPLYLRKVQGIALVVPGNVDLNSGILHFYNFMPYLENTNFRKLLTSIAPDIPTYILHNVACIATYFLNDAFLQKQYKRILFVTARTGTACGLLQNGEVITGHGELGHIKVSDTEERCACGRQGCLDLFFSLNSFIEILEKKQTVNINTEEGIKSTIYEQIKKSYNEDPEIKKQLLKRLDYFTGALIDIINITMPDLLILSGGLLEIYGDPVQEIKRSAEKLLNNNRAIPHFYNTKIEFQKIETDISALGSCRTMIKRDWNYVSENSEEK